MTHIIDNSKVEGLLDTWSIATPPQTRALSAGTLTLTTANSYVQRFTGSTEGQIVKFSDATTYPLGWRYYIINSDGGSFAVQDAASTQLINIPPKSLVEFHLVDNTTIEGYWEKSVHSMSANVAITICGYGGKANTGRYLEFVSGNASNTGPFVVVINGFLVALSVSANAITTATVGVYKLSDLTTPIATVELSSQQTNYVLDLNVPLVKGDLLAVKVVSGSMVKPFVTLYFGV